MEPQCVTPAFAHPWKSVALQSVNPWQGARPLNQVLSRRQLRFSTNTAVEADGEKENDANGGEREVKKVELGAPIVLSAHAAAALNPAAGRLLLSLL